jgi:L-iditol 2-dehydrogenase
MKSIRKLNLRGDETIGVVGLGVMGLLFMLALEGAVGCDLNPGRRAWAAEMGLKAVPPQVMPPCEVVVVCPGTIPALDFALKIAEPEPRIVLFAPLAPGEKAELDLHGLYFQDLTLICSYSCGPRDTAAAAQVIREGRVKAEQVISHFANLDEIPGLYQMMKAGEILKPMVVFEP